MVCITGGTDLIPEKIPILRRGLAYRGEKTTTISLRTSRVFHLEILRSNMLSTNKYQDSVADSTRRRSENLRARMLLFVLSFRLLSSRFFFLLRHFLPTPPSSFPAWFSTTDGFDRFRVSNGGKLRSEPQSLPYEERSARRSNNSPIRAETSWLVLEREYRSTTLEYSEQRLAISWSIDVENEIDNLLYRGRREERGKAGVKLGVGYG